LQCAIASVCSSSCTASFGLEFASIEGESPEPRQRPPFPAQLGLWPCPTVINNVEVLANVPVIITRGAEWYSGIGTATSEGTKFFIQFTNDESCGKCSACNFVCPTGKKVSALTTATPFLPIPNLHNMGLGQRPAVSILYPQVVPNKAVIDKDYCVHLNYDDCGICQEVCQAKAIDYEQKEETHELKVGAIVLSPGCEIFDARIKKDLGYGRMGANGRLRDSFAN
jgi:ferredoxin